MKERYKLVPVEPTPKMLAAGNCAMKDGCYASVIYADMLAASPAVQGEPVYLYRRLDLDDFVTCDFARYTELSGKPNLFETKILYAAPQQAEQRPAPDVEALVASGLDTADHAELVRLGWLPPDECAKLRTALTQAREYVFEPDRDCRCQDCVDAASLLGVIDTALQKGCE